MNKHFLEEESRCGHIVTSKMKKLWSVQIGCLEELKKICAKHEIRYYVSGGTLLGAIRHKGYIPWDDDLDVVMFKDDYDRFCEVASIELTAPYFFQNYQTTEGYGPGMSRIRNSETTSCTTYEYGMVTEDYNCGVFIDIFPMFGVERSYWKRKIQAVRIFVNRLNIAAYENFRKAVLSRRKVCFMNPLVLLWMFIRHFTNHKKVSLSFLKACSMAKDFDEVGLLSFSGFNKKWIWKKKWYDDIIIMPFEYTEVVCPRNYDEILRQQFGDYHVFKKGTAVHNMKVSDPETPYSVKLASLFSQRKKLKY